MAALHHPEETSLSNIRQITVREMGFEKAGEGYFSPDGNTIIFQAVPLGERDYQIYTLDLETEKLCHISKGAGACTCSYFSPDGSKIIFAMSPFKTQENTRGNYVWDFVPYMNIYMANPDGSDLVALTTGPAYHAECAFSPDGTRIVFASNVDGSMNIYTMASDGSDVRQVTHTDHCYNGGPFFSPDGSKIVFRADREIPHLLQIFVVDADGNNLVQHTDEPHVNWAPYWHPSGKALVWTSSRRGHHNYQIFWKHLETGIEKQITHFPCFNGLPVFNREGNKLLWTSKRGSDKCCQLFLADFIEE